MQDQLDRQAWIDQTWGMINAAQAAVPASEAPGLDRAAYEAICRTTGIAPLDDSDIDSYGVEFGDWLQVTVPPAEAAQMTVARWRLERIKHERSAARQAQLDTLDALEAGQAKTAQRCVGCGHPATMIASLGQSCDNCYDELSG